MVIMCKVHGFSTEIVGENLHIVIKYTHRYFSRLPYKLLQDIND